MSLNANAKLWVKALRSGKYKPTKGCLSKGDRDCCLGVACKVYQEIKQDLMLSIDAGGYTTYDFDIRFLPEKVRKFFGLQTVHGDFISKNNRKTNLGRINDFSKKSFKYIADVIESQPKGLFEE